MPPVDAPIMKKKTILFKEMFEVIWIALDVLIRSESIETAFNNRK